MVLTRGRGTLALFVDHQERPLSQRIAEHEISPLPFDSGIAALNEGIQKGFGRLLEGYTVLLRVAAARV